MNRSSPSLELPVVTGAVEKYLPPTHPGEGTYLVEISDCTNSFSVGLCTICLGKTPRATSGKSPKSRKDSRVQAKASKGKAPGNGKPPAGGKSSMGKAPDDGRAPSGGKSSMGKAPGDGKAPSSGKSSMGKPLVVGRPLPARRNRCGSASRRLERRRGPVRRENRRRGGASWPS